ncbi:MAG: hypothetical protein HQL69_16985 [Magnetococcales bacterium]|nr:hypothetical protein [Magnetococcales bacterium]
MGLFSKKKSKPDAAATEGSSGTRENTLLLHVNPGGWSSMLVGADDTAQESPPSWDATELQDTGGNRIELIIQNAIATLGKDLKAAKKISLLIDGIGVTFTDNKPKILHSASPPTARQYGQKLLHIDEVTFGFAEFHSTTEKAKGIKHGVYAFADAKVVRNALTLFEQNGIKIQEVTPSTFMFISRAAKSPTETYAGIQVGAFATTVTLFHHDIGALVVREIPIGYMTMAQAVSEKSGIPVSESLHALGKKDLISEINPALNTEVQNSLNQSMQAQALAPLLIRLQKEIKEVIDFFAYQRVGGLAKELDYYNEVGYIEGLESWLQLHVGIPINSKQPSLLNQFCEAQHPVECNLIKGAETSLLTVGRNKFYFTEKKGFVRSRDMGNKSQTNKASASKRTTRGRTGVGNRRGGRQAKSNEDSLFGGLIGQIRAGFNTGDDSLTAAQELEEGDKQQEQVFFVAFFVLVFGLLYWGFSEYETVEEKYKKTARSYLKLRVETDKFDHDLGGGNILRLSGNSNLTKVLWSEKFLSLATNMSEHIWLTDVSLEKVSREVGEATVESKKMLIMGGVLPSTDGHIMKIADYLENLIEDSKHFMSDFRSVTFSGASLEESEVDPIVRFTIEAWYDKNVRLENSANTEENKPQGISDMNNNIDQHNQSLEEALAGGKKN